MRKEHGRQKRLTGRKALLLTGAIALLAPPAINFDTTHRVITAAFGQPVHCADNSGNIPFDAIAVFDGGPSYGKNGLPFPNGITKKRLKAAAIKYVEWALEGKTPKQVIMLNGEGKRINGSYDWVFRKYVAEISNNRVTVPDGAIINEQAANTSKNAESLSIIVNQQQLRRVAVFTTASHLARTMILTCGWDVAANGFAAEDVIVAHDPMEAPGIMAHLNSPAVRKSNTLEFWKRTTFPYDTHGKLLTWMKEQTRKSAKK